MEKFNDSNLEGKIEPIVLWIAMVIICLITSIVLFTCRVVFFADIILELYEKGMIDEFQKLFLIRRWC